MRNSLAVAVALGVVVLLLLASAGPEYIGLKRAQRDVPEAAARTTGPVPLPVAPMAAKTVVSIEGERFLINGAPTYQGRVWRGARIEGLLFNSRMVQATFDDWNTSGASHWAYPDTGVWDPDRNTAEFIKAMPSWRDHGLIAITVNLQGGDAHGGRYERWVNSAFDANGELHPAYMDRMRAVIQKADELGMVVILGLFYFRHDQVFRDEAAIRTAVDRTIDWLHDLGARNVLIEIDNECDMRAYDHAVLRCERVHELIEQAAGRVRDGHRYLVSASMQGGTLPPPSLVRSADYILLHGNGVDDSRRITAMVEAVRSGPAYRTMPIVFNEDNHYDFDQTTNNFIAAIRAYASWGYYDRRNSGEPFEAGYQSVPVDWRIAHPRKREFFELLAEITGSSPGAVRP